MFNQKQQLLLDKIAAILLPLGRIAIALSGGVDSAVLSAAAARILGPEQVLAITVAAPMVSSVDLADSRNAAASANIRQIILELPDTILDEVYFRENPVNRCYHCKKMIFGKIREAAANAGFPVIADGTNLDDLAEYRPGLLAIRELNVISPLALAELSKTDIRELAKVLCPDFSDKPAMACLATRIPHGIPITRQSMLRIDQAEQQLRILGFDQIRVRDHQGLARIEIRQDYLDDGLSGEMIHKLRQIIHEAGFRFAALDLDGYRTGSMHKTGKDDVENANPS